MALLHLEPLPPRTTRAELLRWLCQQGGVEGKHVGRIDLQGRTATVEVPDSWAGRLLRALDGAALREQRLRARLLEGLRGPEDHFQRLAQLLDLETAAEAEQIRQRIHKLSGPAAEQSGEALLDLIVQDAHAGLGGRFVLTLVKRERGKPLPWTRLGAGKPVLLTLQDGRSGTGWRGVVCERGEQFLSVAVEEPPDDDRDQPIYRVDAASDEAARIRQRQALDRARSARGDRLAELRAVLLGEAEPRFTPGVPWTPLDTGLNASQQEAVRLALSSLDLTLIHGPPGTGKTTTVVEVIRQAVRRGDKVLVCAPSNLAVDNLLERLLAQGEKAVRLGHPARVLPELREHTLDLMVEKHTDYRLSRKLSKEAYALFRQATRFTRAKPEPGMRRDLRQEARSLLADARKLEAQALESILERTPIICSTTTGLDSEVIGQRKFDLVVLDEACQTTEPGCWIPLLRCQRVVLAGDHCQLPPTVLSQEALRQGFGVSLLERLVDLHGPAVTRRLDVQYRMHESIMSFSSREFYDGELQADPTVAGHRLCDLEGVQPEPLTENPVWFIDTAGASYEEEQEPDGDSRFNPREADLAAAKVRALLEAGLRPEMIAVIAPYAAQVRLLRQKLPIPGLEIDSVDGFQGREKEAVVLTLVRSNNEGEIGFLADIRRTNVALTRARRLLLVIADSATLSILPFYQRLFEHFDSLGAYHTVWEEPEGD